MNANITRNPHVINALEPVRDLQTALEG